MSLCIVDLFVTALDVPDPPRSDDLHLGSECLDSKLETNLIVALARAAVADSVSAFLYSDLCNSLCNDRTCKGSTEHILALVNSTCLNGRIYIISDEFFCKIFDVKLGSTCLDSLLFKSVKLGSLTNVARNSDNFAVIVVFL